MSMNQCVWFKDYTEKDIEPYAKLLDHELPMPYGFVIPSSTLTSVFLAPEIQQKLMFLFESGNSGVEDERKHIGTLIEKIVRSAKTPKGFYTGIHYAYEHILEEERNYLKRETHDLHRAYHTLKHIYAPPAVRVAFLPTFAHETFVSGELAVEHAVLEIIIKYFEMHIGSHAPSVIPTIVVQRLVKAQEVGSCATINTAGNRNDQMVIHAHFGAKQLEDAADIYVVQKDNATVISRHSVEQPYKFVLNGTEYKKHELHPQDAQRSVLTDSQIQQVAFLAKDFEKEVYFPQKISFAFEHGAIFVTKLRPV